MGLLLHSVLHCLWVHNIPTSSSHSAVVPAVYGRHHHQLHLLLLTHLWLTLVTAGVVVIVPPSPIRLAFEQDPEGFLETVRPDQEALTAKLVEARKRLHKYALSNNNINSNQQAYVGAHAYTQTYAGNTADLHTVCFKLSTGDQACDSAATHSL